METFPHKIVIRSPSRWSFTSNEKKKPQKPFSLKAFADILYVYLFIFTRRRLTLRSVVEFFLDILLPFNKPRDIDRVNFI